MHICSSSFRRVFSGIVAVLLILSLPQTLKAQDPTEALGAVRQANARLVAGVRNGSATTADTRATLTARFAQLETVIRTTPALAPRRGQRCSRPTRAMPRCWSATCHRPAS